MIAGLLALQIQPSHLVQNTDNKAIAAVTNNCMKFELASDARSSQLGFLMTRCFINNIVDLGYFSRLFASDPSPLTPLQAFYDFGSAFPSLIHEWVFITLRAAGLPDGANIISALYFQVVAIGRIAGLPPRILFKFIFTFSRAARWWVLVLLSR